jgi:2-oxoglutarate ferredoxin oxidoreductase subunit delta
MAVSKSVKSPLKNIKKTEPKTKPVSVAKSKKKKYTQQIFLSWCKACGICIAFCPKKVYGRGEDGKPFVDKPDACIGCRFCELHCPDFAISIISRPEFTRRKTDV